MNSTDVSTIHVHCSTDSRTVDYLAFMWETMHRLALVPERLVLTAHCMDQVAVDVVESRELSGTVNAVKVTKPHWLPSETLAGSGGHAACIENALKLVVGVVTSAVHVICDSDTVVLMKGWDDLIRLMHLNGTGIIGTTYEDIGGFSSGTSNVQTYKKVPNLVWASLSPQYDWGGLEVRPLKGQNLVVQDEAMSQVYNLPVGTELLRDGAWQIPQYLADRKINYHGMKQLKPSGEARVLKGLSDYHEEYHIDGQPFVVHQRGSLKHAYRVDKLSAGFYTAVDAWL